MPECNKCSAVVSAKEAATCVDCKNVYHPACTKIRSADKYSKMTVAAKAAWKCDTCKTESSSRSDADNDSSDDRVLMAIERMRREMSHKFSQVNNNVDSVKEELDGVNSAIDALKKSLESLREENEARREESKKLAEENKQLKGDVHEMKLQLLDMQQYTRKNNIEVVGVPFTKGEDLISILSKIASRIKVPFNQGDISTAHRLPISRRSQHPAIVTQFISRSVKEDWVAAAKANRGRLTAAELNDHFPSTYVYVNDHLTVANKMVLGRAKSLVKQKRLRFAWSKDCKVLIRRTEDSAAVQVRSFEDIDQVLQVGNSKSN